MIRRFRQSELKTFKLCPRQWMLQYHQGLIRKTVEGAVVSKADVGTMYHALLQNLYTGEPYDLPDPGDDVEMKKAVILVQRMFDGYVQWLEEEGADVGITVISVERQIEVPFGTILGDEIVITGRLDLEVVDDFGAEYIIDNKSVQNLDQADLLYLDDQGRTYSLLRRMEGRPVRGFVHNQARRVLRTGSAKPPFFQRVEVNYNDRLLDNHERHMRSTLTKMVEVAQFLEVYNFPDASHTVAPPNPTRDCSWRCPFVHACGMMDDGSDFSGYLEEFFEKPVYLQDRKEA